MDTDVPDPSWSAPTPGFPRRLGRALVLDAALLLILLPLGELAVRRLAPGTSRYIYTDTITGGYPIRLNAYHFRDVEFPQHKPHGEQRILCVGDSTSFGAGLPFEATYAKQLERLLNTPSSSPRWFVINAGGQGVSLSAIWRLVRERGLAFEPSAVVLGFSPTMVSHTEPPSLPTTGAAQNAAAQARPPWERLGQRLREHALNVHAQLHGSYLYVWWDVQLRRRLYRWGVIRDRADQPGGGVLAYAFEAPGVDLVAVEQRYQDLAQEFAALKALLDGRGIPLIVMGIPSRFLISDAPVDNERGFDLAAMRINPMDRMARLCRRHGVAFVDLREVLSATRRAMLAQRQPWDDLYIPTDYAHLNERGMFLAAQALARTLADEGIVVRWERSVATAAPTPRQPSR